jgi:hypothetical protein
MTPLVGDKMNLTERAYKGDKANELLNNEIFSDAMSNVRQAILTAWQNCPIQDRDTQHELKLMVRLLTDLEHNIRSFVQDGNMAKFEIEQQRKREAQKKKVARFL